MVNNPEGYIFSSITASVDGTFEFISSEHHHDIGTLNISMDSRLLINDGQHRKAAIDEAIKENPDLKNESISVVLFIDQGLRKSQQMFSDLNQHAINVSKSLGILYDHRNPEALFTKEILEQNNLIKGYVDFNHSTLAKKSNKLFTLSSFHKANKNIIQNSDIINSPALRKFSISYWNYLSHNFTEWSFVFKKEISPFHSRQSSIATYGVVLEALGLLGRHLFVLDISNWREYIDKLNSIDWNKN